MSHGSLVGLQNSLRLQGQEPVHTRGGREQASKQPGASYCCVRYIESGAALC